MHEMRIFSSDSLIGIRHCWKKKPYEVLLYGNSKKKMLFFFNLMKSETINSGCLFYHVYLLFMFLKKKLNITDKIEATCVSFPDSITLLHLLEVTAFLNVLSLMLSIISYECIYKYYVAMF